MVKGSKQNSGDNVYMHIKQGYSVSYTPFLAETS